MLEGRWFSVDPGGTVLGWAEWSGTVLVACGLSRCKAKTWAERARHHRLFLKGRGANECITVCESMQYRGRGAKGSPQVLIELNAIAGHVGNQWVTPNVWKGRVPKDSHQPRIWARLAPAERVLLKDVKPASLAHNAVDAVGIGMFYSGRLTPSTPIRSGT